MSFPISMCEVFQAAKGDEDAFRSLYGKMLYNWACGHWSQFGCMCEPPCEKPTKEQMIELNEKLEARRKQAEN